VNEPVAYEPEYDIPLTEKEPDDDAGVEHAISYSLFFQ